MCLQACLPVMKDQRLWMFECSRNKRLLKSVLMKWFYSIRNCVNICFVFLHDLHYFVTAAVELTHSCAGMTDSALKAFTLKSLKYTAILNLETNIEIVFVWMSMNLIMCILHYYVYTHILCYYVCTHIHSPFAFYVNIYCCIFSKKFTRNGR